MHSAWASSLDLSREVEICLVTVVVMKWRCSRLTLRNNLSRNDRVQNAVYLSVQAVQHGLVLWNIYFSLSAHGCSLRVGVKKIKVELYSHVPVMRNVLDQLKVGVVECSISCYCTRSAVALPLYNTESFTIAAATKTVAVCSPTTASGSDTSPPDLLPLSFW